MGFETLKNRFFHNFLYNSTCQEHFPTFQVNRNKILGERFLKSPPIRIPICFKDVVSCSCKRLLLSMLVAPSQTRIQHFY